MNIDWLHGQKLESSAVPRSLSKLFHLRENDKLKHCVKNLYVTSPPPPQTGKCFRFMMSLHCVSENISNVSIELLLSFVAD